jgi:hypothetical protein
MNRLEQTKINFSRSNAPRPLRVVRVCLTASRRLPVSRKRVESRMGAVAWAIRQRSVSHPTGSPEAVARPRFPQNVACGFPAPTLFDSWFTALQAPAAPDKGGAA